MWGKLGMIKGRKFADNFVMSFYYYLTWIKIGFLKIKWEKETVFFSEY